MYETYHRKGMGSIKGPADKRLLSGLFAIHTQIVSFLQWRRHYYNEEGIDYIDHTFSRWSQIKGGEYAEYGE